MKQFRAPAVPLATVDPFFNIWSNADTLAGDVTHHWTNQRHHLCATLSVDGKMFSIMGKLQPDSTRYQTEYELLPQTGVDIRPLTTVYTFENDTVALTLSFMTPLLPDDLELLSRPISYISYTLKAKDGKEHECALFFDVAAELATCTVRDKVTLGKTYYSITASMGNEKMLKVSGDDHRIEWGTLHLMAPTFDLKFYTQQSRSIMLHIFGAEDRKAAVKNPLNYTTPNLRDKGLPMQETEAVIRDSFPLLCADKTFVLSDKEEGFIAIGYDDVKSLQYFEENIEAYWKKDGKRFEDIARSAIADYADIVRKADAFDAQLCEKAAALSPAYRDIVALAYRQTVSGHKLTYFDGEIQFVSKENYSNGCAATVDVTYPSIPLFLIYNPKLVEGMLNPIFKLVEKGLWHFDFAPHDAGRYPLVNGQVYGFNHPNVDPFVKQMPVEECGNMLLCVAALCKAENDASYFEKHFDMLRQWADYLVGIGYDPESQLCTDDFAGHLAHNCNLSIKGIMGLAAFDMLCTMCGKDGSAYLKAAKKYAAQWEEHAADGDHYRLAFDQPGSWSIKYNLVWDKLFGFGIFSDEVAEKEIAFYKTKFNDYGLPLDNRADYTKSDWQMWSTCLTDDKEYFTMICDHMHRFLCETPDRIPFTDWYFTSTPYHRGFQARTVQGGLFLPLLKF